MSDQVSWNNRIDKMLDLVSPNYDGLSVMQRAKNDLMQGWDTPAGAICPCCEQKVKRYRGNKMNGKWTKENFDKHHAEHPNIYVMFCHYALQAARVKKYYSAKCVFHRVRWETQITERNSDFKIDDGWISHYARKFMDDHPYLGDFFETRVRKDSYHNSTDQESA